MKKRLSINKIIYLFLLSNFFLLFISCKKYEDGPWISFRSKCERLQGNWDLESLIIGGIDSTKYAKEQSNYGSMEFLKDKDAYGGNNIFYMGKKSHYAFNGLYLLKSKKNNLFIGFNVELDSFKTIGPWMVNNMEWEISKLTENQLWLKINYQNQDCSVHYKNIGD